MRRAHLVVSVSIATLAVAAACSSSRSDSGAGPSGGSVATVSAANTPTPPASYALGHPADAQHIALLDIDVNPAGVGLPPGSGNAATGAVIFAKKCAACHGVSGEGRAGPPAYPKLIGREPRDGFPFGTDPNLVRTVGNYWPYSTTLYDYIHRAMPITSPGSLQPNDVYALVAWILAENEIIPRDAEMNAKALAGVKMPARDKFVMDDRTGGKVFR